MGVNTLPSNPGGCGMSGGGCGDSGYNPGNTANAVAKPAPIIFDETQSGGGDQVEVVLREKYLPSLKNTLLRTMTPATTPAPEATATPASTPGTSPATAATQASTPGSSGAW